MGGFFTFFLRAFLPLAAFFWPREGETFFLAFDPFDAFFAMQALLWLWCRDQFDFPALDLIDRQNGELLGQSRAGPGNAVSDEDLT